MNLPYLRNQRPYLTSLRDSETLVSAGGYDVGEQLRVTRDVLQFVILNSFQNLLLRTHHVRDSESLVSAGGYDVGEQLRVTPMFLQHFLVCCVLSFEPYVRVTLLPRYVVMLNCLPRRSM